MAEDTKAIKAVLADLMREESELRARLEDIRISIRVLRTRAGEIAGRGIPSKGMNEIDQPLFQTDDDPVAKVSPGKFTGLSQAKAAKAFLELVKRPLKTRTMIAGIERGGVKIGGTRQFANMYGVLKRDQRTFKLISGEWGLTVWEDKKQ